MIGNVELLYGGITSLSLFDVPPLIESPICSPALLNPNTDLACDLTGGAMLGLAGLSSTRRCTCGRRDRINT
jgi:hypothetical protein